MAIVIDGDKAVRAGLSDHALQWLGILPKEEMERRWKAKFLAQQRYGMCLRHKTWNYKGKSNWEYLKMRELERRDAPCICGEGYSGVSVGTPIFDLNGVDAAVQLRGYSGGIKLK